MVSSRDCDTVEGDWQCSECHHTFTEDRDGGWFNEGYEGSWGLWKWYCNQCWDLWFDDYDRAAATPVPTPTEEVPMEDVPAVPVPISTEDVPAPTKDDVVPETTPEENAGPVPAVPVFGASSSDAVPVPAVPVVEASTVPVPSESDDADDKDERKRLLTWDTPSEESDDSVDEVWSKLKRLRISADLED